MSNLTTALIIVLSINAMLFLGQAAVLNINPSGTNFYNCQGSILGTFEQSSCNSSTYVLNSTDPGGSLPSGTNTIDPTTGNIFTDAFTTIRSFLLDTLGLSYLLALLSAPVNFLSALGLPDAFTFAVGALWYGITLFLIIAFMVGRDD